MNTDDDKRWLYGKMRNAGVETGSYTEFTASLNDKADRDWYYQKSLELGLDVGDEEEFRQMMSSDVQTTPQDTTPTPQPTTPTKQTTATTQPKPRMTVEQRSKEKLLDLAEKKFGTRDENKLRQMAQEQFGTTDPKEIQQIAKDYVQGGGLKPVQKKTTPTTPTDPVQAAIQEAYNTAKATTSDPIKQGEELANQLRQKAVEMYGEENLPELTKNFQQAIKEETENRNVREQIENLSLDIDRLREVEVKKATDKVIDEVAEQQQILNDKNSSIGDKARSVFRLNTMTGSNTQGLYGPNTGTIGQELRNANVRQLDAAKLILRDAKRMIAEADHNAQEGTFGKWWESSFAGGAARGFAQRITDLSTWDFGLSDVEKGALLYDALNKADKGEQLTPSEQALLDAVTINALTEQYFANQVGRGYKAGQVTAEAIPFMLEMIINPASGIGTALSSKLTRYAIKRFGKAAAKKGVKGFLAKAGTKAVKYGTQAGGSILAGGAMATTTGAGRTTAGAFERANEALMRGEKVDWGEAWGDAWKSSTISYSTEMLGELFRPIKSFIGKGAGKLASSNFGKAIRLDKVQRFIDDVSSTQLSQIVNDFEKNAKWTGTLEEYLEEVLDNTGQAAFVGDQRFRGADGRILFSNDPEAVFNLENNIDTFISVALLGGVFSGIRTVGYRTPKYKAKKEMRNADEAGLSAFNGNSDLWNGFRNSLSFGNVEEVKTVLRDVMTNPDYTEQQKRAVWEYAGKATAYKGILSSEQKRRASGEETQQQIDAEMSFERGYSADEQTAHDIALEMNDGTLGNRSAEERKAAWDGVQQSIEDQADLVATQMRREMAKTQHRADQMVKEVNIIDEDDPNKDKTVYLIDGNVTMLQGGKDVDTENSDQMVTIYDPNTGEKKAISSGEIRGFVSVMSADDVDAQIQNARDSFVQQAIDKAQGKITVNIGDEIPLSNGIMGKVLAISEDGEEITIGGIDENGNPQQEVMQRSDLQAVADATAIESYYQRHPDIARVKESETAEEQQPVAEEQQTETTEEQTPIAETETPQEGEQPTQEDVIDDGFVGGIPAEYEKGMTLEWNDADNWRHKLTVTGNRFTRKPKAGGGMEDVPDPEGRFYEVYSTAEGGLLHIHDSELERGMVGYYPATEEQPAEPTAETPAETPQTPVEAETESEAPITPTEPQTSLTMPMREARGKQIPAYEQATAEQTYDYVYNQAGLDEQEADKFVQNKLDEANEALNKAQKGEPQIGTDIDNYKAQHAKWEQDLQAAQRNKDMWEQVKAMRGIEDVQTPETNINRRGHKQIEHAKKMLAEAQNALDKIDAIYNFINNVNAGAEATEAEKEIFEQAKRDVEAEGYEIIDELGKPYIEGTIGQIDFVIDESLPIGTQTITKVVSPLVLKDGKMVRSPKYVVSKSLFDDEDDVNKAIKAARSGNADAQAKLDRMGIEWKAPVAEESTEQKTPAQQQYEAVMQKYGDKAGHKINVTVADKNKTVADKKKNLEKKQKAFDDAPIGKEDNAEKELVKAQAEYDNALADRDYWNKVKAEYDKVLAEQQKQLEPSQTPEQPTNNAPSATDESSVPDMSADKAADARARGYRMKNGYRYNRQEPTTGIIGNETDVKFTNAEQPAKAKYKVVEADNLQPSHLGGERNPLHFISDAQPKERTDKVSDKNSSEMAKNINPKEITDSVTAYSGAPVVNSRGEVIQGNNRAIALRKLLEYPESAQKYKQYLIDHAAEFGLDAEAIAGMKNPVLVRETDVDDNEAVRLGQFKASDTESGGKERIDAATTLAKMTDQELASAMNRLFQDTDNGDMTLGEIISKNGGSFLNYLATAQGAKKAVISETQLQSAFKQDGKTLTDNAREDIRNLIMQNLFKGAPDNIEAMFEKLPVAAQKALVQVVVSDLQLNERERLLPDIQNAVMVAGIIETKFSTQVKEARQSKDADARLKNLLDLCHYAQQQADFVTGETALSGNYSDLELKIAAMLMTQNQTTIKTRFERYCDLVRAQGGLFDESRKYTREEAVKEVFNVIDKRYETNGNVELGERGAETLERGKGLPEGNGANEISGTDKREAGTGLRGGEKSRTVVGDNSSPQGDAGAEPAAGAGSSSSAGNKDISGEISRPKTGATAEQPRGEVVPEERKVAFTFDTESPLGKTGTPLILKWLKEQSNAIDRKRGFTKLADRINQLKEANNWKDGEYDIFVVFSRNGEILGIGGNVREAYDIALNADEERFYVVRDTKRNGKKRTFGFTDGYMFSDNIPYEEWYGADGRLREDVKTAATSQLERDLDYAPTLPTAQTEGGESTAIENVANSTESEQKNYTITPAQYTTKRGKVLDMHLVTFDRELTKDELAAGKEIAKQNRGWWDRDRGGFMMRDEESAKQLAEALNDKEKVADEQPLSLQDIKENNGQEKPQKSESYKKQENIAYEREIVSLKDHLSFVSKILEEQGKTEKEIINECISELDKLIPSTEKDLSSRSERIQAGADGTLRAIAELKKDLQDKLQKENNSETKDQSSEQEQPKQEQTEEQPKGSSWVDDEDKARFDELKEMLRKKLGGQLNMGFDPEAFSAGVEMSYLVIKHGARKFTDFAKKMIEALGDAVRPYLKSFYNGARDLPEMDRYAKELTPYDEVRTFDVENFDKEGAKDLVKTAATIVREQEVEQEAEQATEKIKKKRNENRKENEKNPVSLQNGNQLDLFGTQQEETADTKENEEVAESSMKFSEEQRRAMSSAVANDLTMGLVRGEKPYKSINDIRKRARALGLDVDEDGRDDVALQEMVEDGLVSIARTSLQSGQLGELGSKKSFDEIVRLYEMQPTINRRSAERIRLQQYSTPLPMSYVADMFVYRSGLEKVLEPTAGNGMMVFGIPATAVTVNEIDKARLANLRGQGFKIVMSADATQDNVFTPKSYDAIVANPPFGKAEAKEYDGKLISGLDEQITLNALAAMKDDGRAAIIIGGNMEYGKNGAINGNKAFWTYLYNHYNVKGVVDMDGKLYARQGTSYPTRMILIEGRRTPDEIAQSTVYPPVKDKAVRKAETFDDLYNIIKEIKESNIKTNGTEILRTSNIVVSDTDATSGNADEGRPVGKPDANVRNGQNGGTRPANSGRSSNVDRPNEPRGVQNVAKPSRNSVEQSGNAGISATQTDNSGRPIVGNKPVGGERAGDNGRVQSGGVRANGNANGVLGLTQQPKETEKRTLTEEKLPYRPHNTAFSLESVAPAAMVDAMDKTLYEIEERTGQSVDEFVTNQLGYDTEEEMHNALAAEQVDSVAMAIYQMSNGNAMIIGDQTGVGKGRQMAALIRWAVRRGNKPIFITQKADLFSDLYRDLVDIGSGDLRPFIFNSDGAIVDSDGKVVHKPLPSSVQKQIFETGKLPDEYDFAVLTYSQVNTGDSFSRKAKKNEKLRPTPKATFLRLLSINNYLLLDESHTAAGKVSNTGAYMRSIIGPKNGGAKAVTFASATFAKRPDTMPMYALRTAMSQANVEVDKLIEIIEKGGVTLQEIMSRALTESGQMVRRERDMSDVRTDWETITDPETVRKARENYDKTIAAFNRIIKFQEDYIKPMVAALDWELAQMASTANIKQGTNKMGVDNTPFASKTFNYTKQLMLALKVDAIVDKVEQEIKAGRHPVIALESTMEASLKEYEPEMVIDEPTFSASLLRGLRTVMQYTVKDAEGNPTHHTYSPHDLSTEGEQAYYDLQDFIRESTGDIFISPLDAIIQKLNDKGYRVGELTGRNLYVERNEQGQVVVKRRTDKDKKRMQREFNNGTLDVLILNKSAATGISLHASKTFADQRQRTMIIAQPLSDINDYQQMIGRIDRTGQVSRGYYINLGLPVPAESRFLMMLATKLKSLNANTTTSQDSKSSNVEAPDLLNKYGSQVVVEYLRDNPEIYVKIGEPIKDVGVEQLDEYKPPMDDEIARLITGRVALLSTQEQDAFYNDVVRRYTDLINYLDSTGSNDLKINVMPLKAKTLNKSVSSEGKDPYGDNPFAKNSYIEEVEMDVLRKPMKADEIKKIIEKLNTLQGTEKERLQTAAQEKSAGERVMEIIGVVEREEAEKLAAEETRYEESKRKAAEDIAIKAAKLAANPKLTSEQRNESLERYTEDINGKVESSHQARTNKIKSTTYYMKTGLSSYNVGQTYILPQTNEDQASPGMFHTPAIFCGYKVKDSKLTPSTSFAVFATLDGRRRVEVKFTDDLVNKQIEFLTSANSDEAQSVDLQNWDSKIPTNTRTKGYILTGNILQAINSTQTDRGNFVGQLISYTDIDGNVHDGVLMPERWEPAMLRESGTPIITRMDEILQGGEYVSEDGKVEIYSNGTNYILTVPKTKKEGGKFFENPVISMATVRGFWERRGKFSADIVGKDNMRRVIEELGKLDVKIKSTKNNNNQQTTSATPLYRSSEELDEQYPTWLSGQTTSTGQHTTQITSTKKTYQHIGDWMKQKGMDGAKVLDASSGLGAGTQALRDMGFDVEDVEPYPSNDREAPTYTRYEDVQGKYDVVISNAVLNVIPDDWRADVLKSMADKVKVGGKLIINVRDAKSIEGQKQKIELDSPSEILVTDSKGNIRAYQKGFTKSELKEYVESQLGEGWDVEIANEGNSGVKSGTAVVVTRKAGAETPDYRDLKEATIETYRDEDTTPPDPWLSTYEESLASARRFGYTKKQHDAFIERSRRYTRKFIADAVAKLNLTDDVQVVETIDEVQGLTEQEREKRRKKRGWYDPKTNRIVIILDNHYTRDDVLKTILHEGAGHYGLRKMFGKHFDDFLDNVYEHSEPEIRRAITKLARDKYNYDFRRATEEYLATMAEGMESDLRYDTLGGNSDELPERFWSWQKIKDLFWEMMSKIGLKVKNWWYGAISENELKYVLWESYRRLKYPGRYRDFVRTAEDVVMQEELKVGDFEQPAEERRGWWEKSEAEEKEEVIEDMGLNDEEAERLRKEMEKEETRKRTPENQTWRKLKERYPNDLVMLSDGKGFYSMYGEDAERVANLLGIVLRKTKEKGGVYVISFPERDLDGYLHKLINAGHRVAVGETLDADGVSEDVAEYERRAPIKPYPVQKNSDSAFAEAVEKGDKEKVKKYIQEAAEAAMPNSNVRDKKGRLQVVYHGTVAKQQFSEFDNDVIYMSSKPELANQYTHKRRAISVDPVQSGRVMPVYVNIVNPYVIDAGRRLWNNLKVDWSDKPVSTDDVVKYAKENGYDGVIIRNVRDNMFDNDRGYGDDVIAFKSSQIKSTGPSYEQTRRWHYPWDNYDALKDTYGPTYDDAGNMIPLSERFNNDSNDIRFRDEDDDGDNFTDRDRAIARDEYERMVATGGYQFQEAMQDSMLGLRKAMQAILGAGKDFRIEEVAGNENAYLAENRMSSTNAAEQHYYFIHYMKPLLEAIHLIAGSNKAARQELTDYMMAKHGLERNQKFAERDFAEYQKEYPATNKTLDDFRDRDYAGLTALTGESDVRTAEAMAQMIVDEYEATHDVTLLWEATKRATGVTLAKIYRSGLLSKESYEQIRDQFDYYIPLQGFDETTSDEVYGYLTSRKGPFGSPIKHAEGRTSKADDPIATIALMADKAIQQANRNEMKKLFLNFVENHPSDLVSVSKLWLHKDAATGDWVPVFPDIEADDTPAEVERKVEEFETKMQQLAEQHPKEYKSGMDAKNFPYRVLPENRNEHQVLVKRNGETFVLTINGNPRAAQALNGLTNPDVKTGGFIGGAMKTAQFVNHQLSAFYTTRDPNFVVSNFFRDMLYSNCMTWVKEGGNYALNFHKNFGKFNPATMRWLFGKWNKGTLDDSKPIEYMFKQFMLNGGETGYTNIRDIEAHKREIARELKRQSSTTRQVWSLLGKQLDLLNESVENCARFAAFITSMEMGRSLERSIYDAKEVSVNFNKKGSGDKMVGATGQTKAGKLGSYLSGAGRLLYVFWNAGLQGMTNFGRAAKRNPKKFTAAAATMFALGAVIPLIAKALWGDDDDDDENAYYNLPEYVRRSNICIGAGDQWITIPLPIEFRAIYGLGELTTGVITGEEHYSKGETARQIISQGSQILPLDFMEGGGGWHAFIPSQVKPIVEASSNKSWVGLPIYKDTPYNQNDPEFTKAYKSADKNIVGASRWLNELTGGDDFKKGAIDINPSKVEYVLNGYLGGYFKVPNQLVKMAETAFGDREFEWKNMIMANRLVKSGDERTANRKLQKEFFNLKAEYEETKRLLKKYENAANEGVLKYAEKLDYLENSKEYGRYLIFDEYKKDIDGAYKAMKEAEDAEIYKASENEYYEYLRELVDAIHRYEKGEDVNSILNYQSN